MDLDKKNGSNLLVPEVRTRRRDLSATLVGGALVFLGIGAGFSMATIQQSALLNGRNAVSHCHSVAANSANNIRYQVGQRGQSQARPLLGVEFVASGDKGAHVVRVLPGLPGESANLKRGDFITEVDGERVSLFDGDLRKIVWKKAIGDSVELEVVDGHSGDARTVELKLGSTDQLGRSSFRYR